MRPGAIRSSSLLSGGAIRSSFLLSGGAIRSVSSPFLVFENLRLKKTEALLASRGLIVEDHHPLLLGADRKVNGSRVPSPRRDGSAGNGLYIIAGFRSAVIPPSVLTKMHWVKAWGASLPLLAEETIAVAQLCGYRKAQFQ